MFEMNPFNLPFAFMHHLVMLVGAGAIGFAIGCSSGYDLVEKLEDELADLYVHLEIARKRVAALRK